jgi:hypothetical protein
VHGILTLGILIVGEHLEVEAQAPALGRDGDRTDCREFAAADLVPVNGGLPARGQCAPQRGKQQKP